MAQFRPELWAGKQARENQVARPASVRAYIGSAGAGREGPIVYLFLPETRRLFYFIEPDA